ncbi:hypothetical protein ACEY4C_13495, partial [Staphylococcus aureus]|uniref:hypothetical protein n=1 Tax=Staphylococcus aureus TaxID=1280 RepID=UPI0035B60A47
FISEIVHTEDSFLLKLYYKFNFATEPKFGHKSYQEDINNYHQKGFDDEENEEEESLMDILDLLTIDENRKLEMVFELIDDLDLEVINEMKVRIDNRLTH